MKTELITIIVTFVFASTIRFFTNHFDLKRYEAEQHASRQHMELRLLILQEEAELARFRAAELSILCAFTDNTGQVYTNRDCE